MFSLRRSNSVASYKGDVSRGLVKLHWRKAKLVVTVGVATKLRTAKPELGEMVASPRELAQELVCLRAGMLSGLKHPIAIEAELGQDKVVVNATGGLTKGLFDKVSAARGNYLQLLKEGDIKAALARETNFIRLLSAEQISPSNITPNEQIVLDYAKALIDAIAAKWQGRGWVFEDPERKRCLAQGQDLPRYFSYPFGGYKDYTNLTVFSPGVNIGLGLAVFGVGSVSVFKLSIYHRILDSLHRSLLHGYFGSPDMAVGIIGGLFYITLFAGSAALVLNGIRGALVEHENKVAYRQYIERNIREIADVKAAVEEVERAVNEATQELPSEAAT